MASKLGDRTMINERELDVEKDKVDDKRSHVANDAPDDLSDETTQREQSKHHTPWLGLGALLISVLTVVASFLILYFINGRHVYEKSYLKPAVSATLI